MTRMSGRFTRHLTRLTLARCCAVSRRPAGADLMIEADALDILEQVELRHHRRDRLRDARLRVGDAVADAAEEKIVRTGAAAQTVLGVVELDVRSPTRSSSSRTSARAAHELHLEIVVDETETMARLRYRRAAAPGGACDRLASSAAVGTAAATQDGLEVRQLLGADEGELLEQRMAGRQAAKISVIVSAICRPMSDEVVEKAGLIDGRAEDSNSPRGCDPQKASEVGTPNRRFSAMVA